MKIILDTNFLLIPGQFKVDVFSAIEDIIPGRCEFKIIDKTIDELEKIIKEQRGKHKNSAKLGLALVKNKRVTFIKGEENQSVDDDILDLADSKNIIVATQDALLKAKLRKKGIKLLTLRQKKYVVLEG